MTTTLASSDIDQKKYAKLLAKINPIPPQNDEDEDRLTAELLQLEDKDFRTPEEEAAAELLTILLDEYGRRTVTFDDVTPLDRLKALMEDRDIKQKDVVAAIGNKSLTSQILSGRKTISKDVAKRLASQFNVPVELFL